MIEYFEELGAQFLYPVTAIAQILGFVPLILSWFIFRAKSRITSIILKSMSDGFSAVHFFLLNQWTGCVINCINTARGILFLQKGKRRWARGLYLPIGFCALTCFFSIISWTGPESLLPMIGSCLAVAGYWQINQKGLRRFNFAGIFLWLIYGFITLSVPTIIGNIISLVSIAVTEIREMLGKRSNKNNEGDLQQ